MLVCLGVGYYVNIWSTERLPYYFDRALLVVPFLGLGFFYRIYESIVDRVLPVKWWVLICLAVCYFGCYVFDTSCLHTMLTAFGGEEFRNFPLYLCYALLGIVMMVRFVKLIPAVPWISFMGVNSLVFYYLMVEASRFWQSYIIGWGCICRYLSNITGGMWKYCSWH